MKIFNTAFLLTMVLVASAQGPSKLGDVFKVDMRQYPQHGGSCNRRRYPNDPNSALLFDANAPFTDRNNILNIVWQDMCRMIMQSTQLITAEWYNNYYDIRKLMTSFFGIWGNPDEDEDDLQPQSGVHLDKLKQVRARLATARRIMFTTTGEDKRKLFCDSKHIKFQYADDFALDYSGNRIVKDSKTGEMWKLADWEASHGRSYTDRWYFWIDAGDQPGDSGYLLLSKLDWPPITQTIGGRSYQFPFLWDGDAGTPSICRNVRQVGVVLATDQDLPDEQPGGEAILYQDHVILCPQSFSNQLGPDTLPLQPQPEGTHLDSLSIIPLTFMHEVFHLVSADDFDDEKPFHARKDANGIPVREWPDHKSGFDLARRPNDGNADKALQCMTIAMYDNAQPQTTDINEVLAIRTPECYAWFAYAVVLLAATQQDYSSGAAMAADSDYIGVTATIPGKREAGPTAWPFFSANFTEGILQEIAAQG